MNTQSGYSILFVDDEEKALKYFDKAFSEKFSILTCSSVADAKTILEQDSDKISVLITDQRMPNEKGIELLKFARQNYPHIIRLLTTAYSDLDDAIEAVNSGEILRYVTKPWDIQGLYTDLYNAVQFFTLRHERDLLLQEKLSIKLQQTEVNRARDLIVMASALTHLRNPVQAIASLLLQWPNIKKPRTTNIQELAGWGLIEKGLTEQFNISDKLIRETNLNHGFKSSSITDSLKNIFSNYSKNIDLTIGKLPSIKFNKDLIDKMINGFIASLIQLHVNKDKINVSIEGNSDGVIISLSMDETDLENTSILDVPVELITAFLACYHHSGTVKIDSSTGLIYTITLPTDPESSELPKVDNDQLDEIFSRFDNLN